MNILPDDKYRVAKYFDGADPTPYFKRERAQVKNSDERQRIASYLKSGHYLQGTGHLGKGAGIDLHDSDYLDPSQGKIVPTTCSTDGEWVWHDGLAYYVECYGIAPEPDFYRHIVAQCYRCPEVSEEEARQAFEWFTEWVTKGSGFPSLVWLQRFATYHPQQAEE